MNDAAYRIDVEPRPWDESHPWQATVVRLSDDYPVTLCIGRSPDEVEVEAVARIRAANERDGTGYSLTVDESGEVVSDHSVKA